MTTSNLNSGYTYRVSIKGDGGEFTLGEISDVAYSHWVKRTSTELSGYVANPEGSKFEPANDDHRLAAWHDLDEFAHEYGIEHIQQITIESLQGEELISLDGDTARSSGLVEDAYVLGRMPIGDYRGGCIFCRTFEKGYCTYIIQSDVKFDLSKLRLMDGYICGVEAIVGLTYDGTPLEIEEEFGREYADIYAELDRTCPWPDEC